MMEIPASELPELVFVGTPFDEERFRSIKYHFKMKPGGGLWTSPVRDGKSEWEHYIADEKEDLAGYLSNHKNIYPQSVSVDPNAKVFMISSGIDARHLQSNYQWDWPLIAENYDAVYVDKQGVEIMEDGKWDLPSVVFFNLDYVSVDPEKL
jgi:hypothetical protein